MAKHKDFIAGSVIHTLDDLATVLLSCKAVFINGRVYSSSYLDNQPLAVVRGMVYKNSVRKAIPKAGLKIHMED